MTLNEEPYRILTEENQRDLRVERIHLIETDLFRARLQLEEALSEVERQNVLREISALQARLRPHYAALGLSAPEESTMKDQNDD